VWERALGSRNTALPAAARLGVETREIAHERENLARRLKVIRPSLLWLIQTEQALLWLGDNTHKLMKCANLRCKAYPFFIRISGASHQKYCSQDCASVAESDRVSRRPPKPPKDPARLSSKGRAQISAAQKRRWEEYRTTSDLIRKRLRPPDQCL
jgi:hypothetical protein